MLIHGKDGDVDLLEMFLVCWGRKWIIAAFVLIGLLAGITTDHIKERDWFSRMDLIFHAAPPHRSVSSKALLDFHQKFYSRTVFESWKQQIGNTALFFRDFDTQESIAGVSLLRVTPRLLIDFKNEENDYYFVARTNDPHVLDGLFNYANHVNRLITEEYLSVAKFENEVIRSVLLNQPKIGGDVVMHQLSTDRFIKDVASGDMVFKIKRASVPIDLSIKFARVLVISVVTSALLAALFVLFRHGRTKRRNQSGKA